MGKHTLVSLFCGCGGFDVGAVKAGFEPLIALDNDPVAIKTYTANIGEVAELASSRSVRSSSTAIVSENKKKRLANSFNPAK